MDSSDGLKTSWRAGFVAGILFAFCFVLFLGVVYYLVTNNGTVNTNSLHNFEVGAWTDGVMAKVFTVCNVAVVLYPFMVWRFRREWYEGAFDFCRKLPTMIGMLGTLWSLVSANLESPGQLAGNFSVAIVSTFIGIVLQIAIEFFGRLRPFCDCEAIRNEEV